MKEIPSLHPEIEEQINWLERELNGEDPVLTKKFDDLQGLGIGRQIYRKDTKNPLHKTIIGISLPLGKDGDDFSRHVLAFTDGSILVVEPNPANKDDKWRHTQLFAPRNKPWESDAWESASELSKTIRQRPEAYYSKVTHCNLNPDHRHEAEEFFSEALEKAFIIKENERDGLKRGSAFLKDALPVFDAKKKKI